MRFDNGQEALGIVPDLFIEPQADFVRRAGILLQAGSDVEAERGPAAKVSAEFLAVTPKLGLGSGGLKLEQDAFARRQGNGRTFSTGPSNAVPVGAFV